MQRKNFKHKDISLSYLDAGGDGEVLIALHAHWMEASTFEDLASGLAPRWRVIALDQRGHGYSNHTPSYSREDYLGDLEAFFSYLELTDPVVLLGHSLGGVNAYQFAAGYPKRVCALIIEDIGVEINVEIDFILNWSGIYPIKEALAEKVGPRMLPYLEKSFRHSQAGWTLAFEPSEIVQSQKNLCGDHWKDWIATNCPTLLIRGSDSRVTSEAHLKEMAERRPNTKLITLAAGHVVHQDNPVEFLTAVQIFLSKI